MNQAKEIVRSRINIRNISFFLLFSLMGTMGFIQSSDSSSVQFIKHTLTGDFISEGVAVGDVNNDGKMDVMAGPPLLYWFESITTEPFWIAHEIDHASGAGLNLVAQDVTHDGLVDIVVSNFKGVFVFENKMKK